MMVDDTTKEWLQRMAYGHPAGGKSGEVYRTEGSEHARRILAALDEGEDDNARLEQLEEILPVDDLAGEMAALVKFHERVVEASGIDYLDELDESQRNDEIVAAVIALAKFKSDVRDLLVGTGVMAPDDQASNPIDLLRLFLPSGSPA